MKKLGDIIYQDSNIKELLDAIEAIDDKTRVEVLKAISQKLTQSGKAQAIKNIRDSSIRRPGDKEMDK